MKEERLLKQPSFKKEVINKNKIKYIVMDYYGEDRLYIEYKDHICARFLAKENKWINGENELNDARVGYDPSEPEGSFYRYGNSSCMYKLREISKEEAEKLVGFSIDPDEIRNKI